MSTSTKGAVLVDPTSERANATRERAPRLTDLKDLTAGLLDISKARGDVFLDRLSELLIERGIKVERYAKPTFTKVAPIDLRREIAQKCNFVIEALAD
ncbi:MAG: hypothetical protein JHD17_04875 [Acidimicrobiia bacterium]|nr:hypothetical protein [Acidimicrobiia bacterium]